MSNFWFKDRRIATRLKMQAANPAPLGINPGIPMTDLYLFQTPSGGIPAISGTTLGKADCTLYKLSFDGTDATIEQWNDSASNAVELTVFNMGSDQVPASVFIQAVRINGLYVANWEQC